MGKLEDIGKETYMNEQGYEWDDAYEAFISHQDWKIFTRNFLEDHNFDTIREKVSAPPTEGRWQVYTNNESEEDIHNIHRHFGATS